MSAAQTLMHLACHCTLCNQQSRYSIAGLWVEKIGERSGKWPPGGPAGVCSGTYHLDDRTANPACYYSAGHVGQDIGSVWPGQGKFVLDQDTKLQLILLRIVCVKL